MLRDKLLNICAYIFQKEQEMMEQNGMYAAEYDENGAYMEQEEEWEREGLLDPAWEKQQKKVSESDVTWTLSAMRCDAMNEITHVGLIRKDGILCANYHWIHNNSEVMRKFLCRLEISDPWYAENGKEN